MAKLRPMRVVLPIVLLAGMTAEIAIAKVPPAPVTPPGLISYYSDATKANVVGQEIVTCEGARYLTWGVCTSHLNQDLFYCPPSPIEM